MAIVTYFVAMPFVSGKRGMLVADTLWQTAYAMTSRGGRRPEHGAVCVGKQLKPRNFRLENADAPIAHAMYLSNGMRYDRSMEFGLDLR